MSAETIQSQYENLQQVAQRFARRAETIQQLYSTVNRQSQRLAGSWEGKAATAFMQEMRSTLLPGVQRLSSALEQSSRTTTKIAQRLRQAEEEAARLFQGKAEGGFPAEGMGGGGLENGGMVMLAQYSPPSQDGTAGQTDGNNDGYTIEDIQQTELSVFFSQYEDSDSIPDEVLEKYLTNPELMAIQREVITNLAERVQNGEPPLTQQQFYEMVLAETGDPTTALIVAHNITKSLARGLSPIGWTKESDNPLVYSMDGQQFTIDPATFHPDAVGEVNGRPSVFYAMFSDDALGTNDPGDWYHFYLQASATYLGATSQIEFDNSDAFLPWDYERVVDGAIDDSMSQMRSDRFEENDIYRGWRYANSLSYLEGAKYGEDYDGSQDEVLRESNLHREGAVFGLSIAGLVPNENLPWYVPEVGAASGTFDTGVDIDEDTYTILDSSGDPLEEGGN